MGRPEAPPTRRYHDRLCGPANAFLTDRSARYCRQVYTILVLANGVEVKGAVKEVALKKGTQAEWWVG